MHYWYFVFSLKDEPSGYSTEDRAVTSSLGDMFPFELVETWAKEEVGESAKIRILSTNEITQQEYELYCEEIGVD